jgi:uncharacterized membrane protein YccC
LRQAFVQASASLPPARELYRERGAPDEMIRRAAVIGRVREFFAASLTFAEAHETFLSREPQSVRSTGLSVSNDRIGAVWAGLRAAMALLLVSTFWILADWPSGVTAAILAAVVTARLATMEHAVPAATRGALLFVLLTVPSFIVVEVLLPDASGFAMFALVVAPVLFCCACLMAQAKTAGLGFLAGLYFANVGGFQNRMAYDPVGFLNTSIALVAAVATAAVLFAIVAPETPQAARRRFVRAVRKAFERIVRRRPRIGLSEFETAVTEALEELRSGLHPDRGEDVAAIESGLALLGAGRELIRVRDDRRPTPDAIAVEDDVVRFLASSESLPLDRARRAAEEASLDCLAELRDDRLGAADARAAAREMVAFAAIQDELARGGELLLDDRAKGAPTHVA